MFQTYKIFDFIPEKGMNILFHINRLEEMPPLPADIISPHKHLFYELFLVRTGKALHKVDYQEYALTDHTFFFISQGQLHFWNKTHRENINGYRLMFTEDFFLLNEMNTLFLIELVHFDNIYQRPFLQLSPQENELVYIYFDLLYQEFTRPECYEKALQSLLFLLLSEVRRVFQKNKPTNATKHQAEIFKKFLILLEANFDKKWTVTDFAAHLFLSPRHLNRIVQNITNQNLTTVIQNRSLLEAKRLLTFSSLTVRQVSEQLGFEDSAYFARFFRKMTGVSPTDFKENLSEKYPQ